ncbi:hypothetical protein [Thermoflexus sp.]|uniref:hypothetical protein n=1 Tax=Thermoflexus sp. TaxID=1969742 RepID=UPI002ADE4D02|nr:hypothetical protein [Thermoflexus sp.]
MAELTWTGFVLSSIVAGILGNRADAVFCSLWRTIYDRLRRGDRPVRDLQQAIRRALLQATRSLLSDALRERGVDVQNLVSRFSRRLPFGQPRDEESRWLWRAYHELTAELGRVSDAEYVPPSSVAESRLAFLLQPQGVAAEERGKELRERLTNEWLQELRGWFGEPPEVFIKRLREGWQPPEGAGRVSWFDLVCAFFAHEVKHNDVVFRIVTAKLLAGLEVDGRSLGDAFLDYLERQFAPVLERLEAVQRQLEELGRQQREGFEELKARQAELTAILLPMRETQQALQALLADAAGWVRWIAERFGVSHVAAYLDRATRRFLWEKWAQGFVGRKGAMERLNRFIAANPNGVAVVYAPAGYGKTAFLARWIRQVEGRWIGPAGDGEALVEAVCHFFSTAVAKSTEPPNAYAHLLAQLARLSNSPFPIPDRDDERWAALHNLLADRRWPPGVKAVLVLDGLDEAEGKVEPFVPRPIPDGLFVIVSGRWDGKGKPPPYLKEWARFAEFIPLEALSEEEIREWLRTTGEGELAQLAEKADFVRTLWEKTGGFPLFIRYLMEDLAQAVRHGRSPEQVLEQTPSGFSEYVQEQFGQLAKLVRNEKGVRDLFALLTVAKGALRQDEAEELTGLSVWDLEGLPYSVIRWFSIGRDEEQETYAFAHPLLAEEFRRHLGREAKEMEDRLLQWCAGWPAHPSPYILRHYADHLHEKGDPALFRLALDPAFAEAQARHLPGEPHLPLKTVRLALEMAIRSEDAPRMAALLIEHARRAGGEETPLQAWRRGHRERALRMATEILFERDPRLGTLWSLLLAWAAESEGEGEWARRILEAARKRWEGAKLEKLEDWQGELAAFWLGELGAVEGAAEAAGLMLDDAHKGKVAAGWASRGLFDRALNVAEGIQEAWKQASAFGAIAEAMARAGMWEQARQTAEATEEPREQAWALWAIAEAMASAGMWEQARQTAEAIKEPREQAWALGAIAKAMASAGMTQQAQEAFHKARRTAEAIKEPRERAEALGAIAEAMARAGMWEQARRTAEAVEEPQERAKALGAIAEAMARAGMTQQAQEAFHQALQTAEAIKGAWEQAWALRAIAEAMARAGMTQQALWEQARRTAEAIKEPREQAWALRAIAEAMASAGMWEQALRTAEVIERARERAEALGAIAKAMASAGMWEQARRTAEAIKELRERAEALGAIAEAMARIGEAEGAAGIMEREIGAREQGLLAVLQALTERAQEEDEKSKRVFLRLLPLCGWSLELAYSACGLLARLYPHQAEGIARAIRGMPPAA